MDVDPLEVLRKAIRLHEAVAAREQAKGVDKASLMRMAESMKTAADLSIALSAIESRLGINSSREPVTAIAVEYVATDAQVAALRDEAVTLKARIAELEAAQAHTAPTVATGAPDGAPSVAPPASADSPAAAPAPSNVVSLPPSPRLTAEEIAQRKARNEAHYGASVRPHSDSYPTDPMSSDDPYRRGAGRFDNRII
jgi:hypothetical protein